MYAFNFCSERIYIVRPHWTRQYRTRPTSALPLDFKRTSAPNGPQPRTQFMAAPISSVFPSYRFSILANCSDSKWDYRNEVWFWALVGLIDVLDLWFVLMGLCLNALSLLVLSRACDDSIMALILRHVAVVDELVLVVNTYDAIAHSTEAICGLSPIFHAFIIYTHPPSWTVQASLVTIRNWSMVVLSVSRTLHIVYPFRARRWVSPRSIGAVLLTLWIVSFGVNSIKFAEVTAMKLECPEGPMLHLSGSNAVPGWYVWLISILFNSMIPLVITISSNTFLIRNLRRSVAFRRQNLAAPRTPVTPASSVSPEKNSTGSQKLVIGLSMMFILCQIPMLCYGIEMLFVVPQPWIFILTNVGGNLINNIDSSCNFWVYIRTNQRFERAVRKYLPCLSEKRPPRPEITLSAISSRPLDDGSSGIHCALPRGPDTQ